MSAHVRVALRVLLSGATIVAAATCSRVEPPVGPRLPVRLTILGINDFHGALEERTVQLQTSGGTTASVRIGGGALLASYVAKMKESNPAGTLLLSGGDMWQGSLESNYFEGRSVVLLDNAMGVDAAALGNHEFDYGPLGPDSLADPRQPAAQRYGALEARRKEMRFPLLAANVRGTEDGVPDFEPWTIVERKGVKIAVIGLATEDTPNVTQRPNVAGFAFDPPAPALERVARKLRAKGADLVVGVGHLGGNCGRGTPPDDLSRCNENDEVMQVLAALPPGTIDAFVAGHTHEYIAHIVNGVPVIQSGAYGSAIGRIELEWDAEKKKLLRSTVLPPQSICRDVLADTGDCTQPADRQSVRPIVVPAAFQNGPIEPSAEVQQLLAPFRQEVAEMKAEVLAIAERPIGVKRHEPSEMGALVTDELVAATRRYEDIPDAVFALQNAGGMRTALPKGEITYGALYEVLPFDNMLVTMDVTGEQVEKILGAVVRGGRVFQTSGLSVEVKCDKSGAMQSVKAAELATGKPLAPKQVYTVVWNEFLANGGDGTREALQGVEMRFHGRYLMRDVIAEGLRERSVINSAKDPLLDPKKPRLKLAPGCKPPSGGGHGR